MDILSNTNSSLYYDIWYDSVTNVAASISTPDANFQHTFDNTPEAERTYPADPGILVATPGANNANQTIDTENWKKLTAKYENAETKRTQLQKDIVVSLALVKNQLTDNKGFGIRTIRQIMDLVREKYGTISAADQNSLLQKIENIPTDMTILDYLLFIRTQPHPEFSQMANQMKAILKATSKDHKYVEVNALYLNLYPTTTLQTVLNYTQFITDRLHHHGRDPQVNFVASKPANPRPQPTAGAAAATTPARTKKTKVSEMCEKGTTPPSTARPPPFANGPAQYCICHGWQISHGTRKCFILHETKGDPTVKDLPALKLLTAPCVFVDSNGVSWESNIRIQRF